MKPRNWFILICLPGIAIVAFAGWQIADWQGSEIRLRDECRRAAQLHKWSELEQLGLRWTSRNPGSGEGQIYLAEAYNRQEKYQQAVDALARVPATSPLYESAVLAQAEVQFGPLNRPRDGAATCERLLQLNPQSEAAQQRLIFFLTMTLQRVKMIKQIRTAFETLTEPREAYVYLFFADSLFFSNGADLNSHWLEGEPGAELFEVAQAIFIAERLEAGISMDDREMAQAALHAQSKKSSVLEKMLQKYPHNAELLAIQLRECVLTGDVNKAVKLLAQAPVEAEQDNRFWRFKGWVHSQADEDQEAEAAYRQAIKLHPLDWGTRHLLAELLRKQQRFPEVEQLKKLVNQANEIRRTLHRTANSRQVADQTMAALADYAANCGDQQMATVLKRRIQQFSGAQRRN